MWQIWHSVVFRVQTQEKICQVIPYCNNMSFNTNYSDQSTDAGSGFHSDALSLLLPASAWLHDCHSRYRRPYIIAHWILSLFLRWPKWDRGIPGLGICHTRCEAENDQILLKTCSSRLAHVFGLRSFISQVKKADNCSLRSADLFFIKIKIVKKILQFQWIPQLSPTIHNDQVCTLATFRQGRQNVISSFLDAHGAGPSILRFSCTFQIFSIFGAVSTLLGMAMSYLNTMVGN